MTDTLDRNRLAGAMKGLHEVLTRGHLGTHYCDSGVQDDFFIHDFAEGQRVWGYGPYAVYGVWSRWSFWQVSPRLVVGLDNPVTGDGRPATADASRLRFFVLIPEGQERASTWPSSRDRRFGFSVRKAEVADVSGEDGPWLAEIAEHLEELEAVVAAAKEASAERDRVDLAAAQEARVATLQRARQLYG